MPADSPSVPVDWPAAQRALAEAIRECARDGTGAPGRTGLGRVEVNAPQSPDQSSDGEAELFDWLSAQSPPRGFWKGRDERAARAFCGVADRFEDPARLCAHLADELPAGAGSLRYYGGTRFDAERAPAGGWEHFGSGAFVLPRFELIQGAGGPARLVCHLTPDDDAEAVAAQAEQLPVPASGEDGLEAPVTKRCDRPGRDAWGASVRAALDAIAEGALRKVVLARRTTLRFGKPLDSVHLLKRLRARAPEGFAFLVQPRRAGAFLGASPERLFRQRGRRVQSEAVAGTRPRAASADADAALRDELLHSDKDRREHAFVQQHVRRVLRPLCTGLEEREAPPLTLASGRHLHARLDGRLAEGVHPSDVLRALHPTPAVGGLPTEAAQTFIRRREPFDRGWYAAPVGWIGIEDDVLAADLAVGIRSGLVRTEGQEDGRGQLDLFAGAGLVEGSVPEDEWDEVEQKLGNFAALLPASEDHSGAVPLS